MVGNLQSLGYASILDGPFACLICRHQRGTRREVTSSNRVFGILPEDTTFQMQIINFGQKTAAIWEGKFPVDYSFTQEYFFVVIALHSQLNSIT